MHDLAGACVLTFTIGILELMTALGYSCRWAIMVSHQDYDPWP